MLEEQAVDFYNNLLGEFIEKINTGLYEDGKADLNFEFE